MNPVGNTTSKSCGNDLHPSENRQGMLADLRPSSPSPSRVATIAHPLLQSSKRHFFAIHPATPGGNGAADGQARPRQEDPLHDLSREHCVQALNTGVYARVGCMPPAPSYLRNMDDAVSPASPAQEESPGPFRTTGQIGATFFGEALQAPSGGENANLFDMVVNCLLSDDYEAYHPEAARVQALMADYEATLLDTGAAPPTDLAQEHPPMGESPGPARTTGLTGAPLPDGALEAPSGQAIMTSGGERADLFDLVANRLLSDDYEAYDPESPNMQALMADFEATLLDAGAAPPASPAQEHPSMDEGPGPARTTGQIDATPLGGALEAPSGQATMASGGERGKRPAGPSTDPNHTREKKRARGNRMLLNSDQRQAIVHIFKTDLKRSNQSIADEFGVSYSTIKRLKKIFSKTGAITLGDRSNRLSVDQRQTLLHIFKTEPQRSNLSIVDECGFSISTIKTLRKRFKKTGVITPGDHANRLSVDQRRAIVHIFETDPERSHQSLVDEFDLGYSTIKRLKERFDKTGNISPGDSTNRLSVDQRQAIAHIFETDPERSNQSIADEFDISMRTIRLFREKFNETGNISPGDSTNRLSVDQRRVIVHIFEADPKRSSQSIADEFGVSYTTIRRFRVSYGKTGNITPGDHTNRLNEDQRRTIVHIFKTNPKRGNQSIANEFGVSIKTIYTLRRQFGKTGHLKQRDLAGRLNDDQRRDILHIFETEPKRSNQSLADEFGIACSTIQLLKKKFSKTGNLKPGDLANRLKDDQRRAILHIFETEPERDNQSLSDEFDVSYSTIKALRKQFDRTGNLKPGDHGNRLKDDQRRAILFIFETDPKRKNESIADEFNVTTKTIRLLRKKFSRTGNLKPGDHGNRLTADQRQAILHIFETEPERSNQSLVDEFGVSLTTLKVLKKTVR